MTVDTRMGVAERYPATVGWIVAELACLLVVLPLYITVRIAVAWGGFGALAALLLWMLCLLGISRFHRSPIHGLVALGIVCAIWLFQRIGFLILIPGGRLTSGFFEQPAGAAAKFWVLEFPYFFGVGALVLSLVVALISGYRNGQRWSLIPLLPWWLAAWVVFSLPSLYLGLSGGEPVY